MSYRKKIVTLLLVSVGLFIFAFLTDPISGNFCEPINYDCNKLLKSDFGVGLFLFSAVFTSLSLTFLFTKQAVFRTWSKFAIPYLILAIALITISPSSNPGIYGLDSELIAWFTSGLFLIISLLIIAIKSWKLRGK